MQTQNFSTQFADILSKEPFPINGNATLITIYANLIDYAITRLGWEEHTGDWDPYLIITKTDDTTIETETGYENIEFGDFNDEEQFTAILHTDEITSIGFTLPNPNEDEEPILTFIPLSEIKSIQLIS